MEPIDHLQAAQRKVVDAQNALNKPFSINPKLIEKNVYAAPRISNDIANLGSLSARYESGGNPGRISTGKGDLGGASYGAYQFANKTGTLKSFLNSSDNAWKNQLNQDLFKKNKAKFDANWQSIAKNQPKGFANAQHKYIHDTHYKPLVDNLKKQKVLDVNQRSKALKDTVWSVGVQHGPGSRVIQNALRGKKVDKLNDANIINAIYKERGSIMKNGNLKYFPKSPTLKSGLIKRFKDEEKRALQMLNPSRKPIKPIVPPLPKPKGMNNQILGSQPSIRKPLSGNRLRIMPIPKPNPNIPILNQGKARIKTMPITKPVVKAPLMRTASGKRR